MNISLTEKLSMSRAFAIGAHGEARFPGKAGGYLALLLHEPGAEFYSQARVAHKLRCDIRTVRRALAWLRLNGLVTVSYRRRLTARVELVLPALRLALAGTLAVTRRLIAAGFKSARAKVREVLMGQSCPASKSDLEYQVQKPPSAGLLALLKRQDRGR